MDNRELKEIAVHSRRMKEAGVALMMCSFLLAIFLFIPLAPKVAPQGEIRVSTVEEKDVYENVPIQAKAAIVYDLATKEILYEKHSDAQLPLASLTKLLTVYAAVETFSPNTLITISDSATELESTHVFSSGTVISFDTLAKLTLTASLNDGAAAIAEAVSIRKQITTHSMLAGAASALGLDQTYAVNGSGLDENEAVSGGYGSAYDMAILAGALAERAPDIAFATTQATTSGTDTAGYSYSVGNTNPTVQYTSGILLSKTGFTDLAGGNLAIVFDVGINHPISVVVLGSTQEARFTDAQALVSATLARFANITSL